MQKTFFKEPVYVNPSRNVSSFVRNLFDKESFEIKSTNSEIIKYSLYEIQTDDIDYIIYKFKGRVTVFYPKNGKLKHLTVSGT